MLQHTPGFGQKSHIYTIQFWRTGSKHMTVIFKLIQVLKQSYILKTVHVNIAFAYNCMTKRQGITDVQAF